MGEIDHLWAGWRSDYVGGAASKAAYGAHACVFCALADSDRPDSETSVVWRTESAFAVLNAYPYGTGHLLVIPRRHVSDLDSLDKGESLALWDATQQAVSAIESAYNCDGINLGMNLGAAAGAGIPDHLHMHVLPRWSADTNFMTSVANTRVLPEALEVTWRKLKDAWTSSG